MLATCFLAGVGPVAGSQRSRQVEPSSIVTAAAAGLVADAVVASASVRVKVDPHAARTQYVHKIDFADFAPNPLRVADASSVASAQASGEYEAHVTPSSDGVAIVATGHLDGLGKRTANGGEDPESSASAALEVHVSATGDIPYTLRATLNASGHAPACAAVSMRLVGDTVAEDLKAEGPSTATDPGCNNRTPGQVDVTTNGVVHAKGDLAFRFSAVLNVIDPGSVRTDRLHADWNIVLTLHPPSCALKGVVRDGTASDGHQNPLEGVRVQLWRGSNPVGDPVATDTTGTYCIPAEHGVTDPGAYSLRATLIDAANNPPLIEVRRNAVGTEAESTEVQVSRSDFGSEHVDVIFTGNTHLQDDANMYWQSKRFVDWVIEKLGVPPTTFGHVVIQTFSGGTTRYGDNTVYIQDSDSPYAQRNGPYTECPKNCEWHEISHHIGHVLGIADSATAAACQGRTNHAGYANTSTCDSLSEGFAEFLPVLASLDIDAGRGNGYATTQYSIAGLDMANDDYDPWTTTIGVDGVTQSREEFAVAQLLWYLADDVPSSDTVETVDPADPSQALLAVDDKVALGGVNLVHLLAQAHPQTVADIYDALEASPSVPLAMKTRDPAYAPGVTQDISPLDEEFLAHGFYPVHDQTAPAYDVGDPISRSDYLPGSTGLVPRRNAPHVPGEAIRLQNTTASAIEFTISLSFPRPSGTQPKVDEYRISVPAASELLFPLEVAPYWRHVITKAADMPACGGPDQRLVTIQLSGPGIAARTLDSCEYLHDVLKAIDGAALSYGGSLAATPTAPAAAVPPIAPAGADSPIGVALGSAAVVLEVFGAAGLWVRSRRRRVG